MLLEPNNLGQNALVKVTSGLQSSGVGGIYNSNVSIHAIFSRIQVLLEALNICCCDGRIEEMK